MEVKLLRKLRKRFFWYYDRNSWNLFDRKLRKIVMTAPPGLPCNADYAIFRMMCDLNLSDRYSSLRERIEYKRMVRIKILLEPKGK